MRYSRLRYLQVAPLIADSGLECKTFGLPPCYLKYEVAYDFAHRLAVAEALIVLSFVQTSCAENFEPSFKASCD